MPCWVPSILRPDYTWPRPTAAQVSEQTPAVPPVSGRKVRRFWGFVHRLLAWCCEWYCSCCGIERQAPIFDLPFGLVLKWSDRTRVEEAVAMQMARAAGMPVPRVLNYGEHIYDPSRVGRPLWPVSILMTRLPGWPLVNSRDPFIVEEEETWFTDLHKCLNAMRQWECPFENQIFASVIGTGISSPRIPNHMMGPFKSESELNENLRAVASDHAFSSAEHYQATLVKAKSIDDMQHRLVFTHGDLKAHNILVDEEYRLSGFLDWECAGWCPEYWDFTTAMRFGKDTWWGQGMSVAGGDQYKEELECDRALNRLTVDSYVW